MFSAISGLFSGVSFYIILGLASLLSISAYFNYKQIGDIAVLKVAQDSYVEALKSSQNQLEKKDESCKIDSSSSAQLETEKQEVQTKVDVVVKDISSLKSGLTSTVHKANGAPQNANESNVLYGPELLSLDLRLLLDKSYCIASPDDSSVCGTAGQSSSVPMQSNTSR